MGSKTVGLWIFYMVLSLSSAYEVQTGLLQNHINTICSTWGYYHYKTFDNEIYQFQGDCTYNLVSDCQESYQEFSVYLKRSLVKGHPRIDKIVISIKDMIIILMERKVIVNDITVKVPYYNFGILIYHNAAYTIVQSKVGLNIFFNQEDAIMIELDPRYKNKTCGLCGDYNGVSRYHQYMILKDITLYPIEFGNLPVIQNTDEECWSEEPQITSHCSQYIPVCRQYLTKPAFSNCSNTILNLESYIQACVLDMCSCGQYQDSFCLCSTITEYSKQCSHSGGHPNNWRTANFCHRTCPENMVYKESGSMCINSCSHLEIQTPCEEHYMDGCFCPKGTVQDDHNWRGCVPVNKCYCKYGGSLYSPGQIMENDCEKCTCISGRWNCTEAPCPGVCAVEGGAYFTTFDGKKYTFHGNCYYVLSQGMDHVILGELSPCSANERDTCLKSIKFLTDHKLTVVTIKSDGRVLLNDLIITLPHVAASFTIKQLSHTAIILETTIYDNNMEIRVQLVPMMQLYITVGLSAMGQLKGLCGNFNYKETDDFQTSGGLVEATASAFANTWKAQPGCQDKIDWLDDPCHINTERYKYADYWCSLLEKANSPFSNCHPIVDPSEYAKRCRYHTCNCKKSEICMCAALSSYVTACAIKGIILRDWRKGICDKYSTACTPSQIYLYSLSTCPLTCHSLTDGEKVCVPKFLPIDGCGCKAGEYLNENDQCFQDECISGCVCPEGLLDDGKGRCVAEDKCPCVHNKQFIQHGSQIKVECNTCLCKKGQWICTEFACYGTCTAYANGHYITFDGKLYDFNGNCEYVVAQDYCGEDPNNGSFSVTTETIPCGSSGIACSKSIRIFIGRTELKLEDKHMQVVQGSVEADLDYMAHEDGNYLVILIRNGVYLIWDKKTTVFVRVSPEFKGKLCGLCGNFDDKSSNDFTINNMFQVANSLEFGNSWKVNPTCPDIHNKTDPCKLTPHRRSWAEKQCSLIKSDVFKICHTKVDPTPFFDACVNDACFCEIDGDCDCFCTAVSVYAQECTKAEACVYWRTPDICPIFCDYYNPTDECEWHYYPCGNHTVTTCMSINNVNTNVTFNYLEGCYPSCPAKKPYFDEVLKICVNTCGCYFNNTRYEYGEKVPSYKPSTTTLPDTTPEPSPTTSYYCVCRWTDWISLYNVTSGVDGGDFEEFYKGMGGNGYCTGDEDAVNISCRAEAYPSIPLELLGQEVTCDIITGLICRNSDQTYGQQCFDYEINVQCCSINCPTTPKTTPEPSPTTTHYCVCRWTDWTSLYNVTSGVDGGDFEEFYKGMGGNGYCTGDEDAVNISCRAEAYPSIPLDLLGQKVTCDIITGLICRNSDQTYGQQCLDYEINVQCCSINCPTTQTTTTTTTPTTTTVQPSTTVTCTMPLMTTMPAVSLSTECYCMIGGEPYKPGTQKRFYSGDSCSDYICTMDCQVLIADYFYSCPSSPKTSAPTTSSLSTKELSVTTKELLTGTNPPQTTSGICTLNPPRQHNETWMLCDCMMARCIENNLVEITPKLCDPRTDITCTNELPPLNVSDSDGCCWHWECPCECKGFGDPHYVTFDGTYYDFQGECTYVLVEEIKKEIENFGVYVDNYNCGDYVACSRNLIIHYKSEKIEIGPESLVSSSLQVMVNKDIVGIPYKKNEVEISRFGRGYVVEITTLNVKIKFEDESFIISLPYGHFGNNTQGLCGICSNNKSDDCMLRNGTVIDDCSLMAASWLVPNTNKPQCPSTKTTTTSYTPVTPCIPSSLCELITGPTFQECNFVLTPDIYYQACIFDSCYVPDSNIECKTIQLYASLCLDQGICIDWRSKAPACNISCPPEKVYLPCGPSVTPTCQTTPEKEALIKNENVLSEGCFCPNGTKPFSPTIDVCVADCGCIGPNNIPRQFGEIFEYNCEECVCREGGVGIFCTKMTCPMMIVEVCDLEGFYPVTQARPDNPCCEETICMCNTSRCTNTLPKCDLGYEVAGGYATGHCCPVYKCVPKKVCVYRNAEYLGFELKQKPGQCCGVCEQTRCVVINEDTVNLLKPEEILPLKNDNCTVYKCIKEDNRLIHLVYKITCPLFFEEDCEPGTIHLDQSGCCKLCIPQEHSCKLQRYKDYLSYDNCRSPEKIELSRCTGACEAYSMYSPLSRNIAHKCSCCKELKTTKKFVYLDCPDGNSVKFRYVDVDECNCVETKCDQLK
eukprot:XP_012817353.1 PREDICTED: mucin-2-like [Xenopus tropicalis]